MNSFFKKLASTLTISTALLSVTIAMPIPVINYKPAPGAFCHDYGKYGYPGKSDYYLCREGYVVAYNCKTKQPNYVIYELTGKSTGKKLKRKDDFRPDTSIPENCRSELSDYKNSGYDRGHLAAYASVDFSKESASQSFLLSNMSPQKPDLNRMGWATLEKYVRFWAKSKGEIWVYTGTVFKKNHQTIGKNKVAVPSAFYKVIYAPKQDQVIAFLMPNKKISKSYKSIEKYRASVADIEKQTGLTFFPNLTESQKNKVSNMWLVKYNKPKRGK